MSKFNIRQCPVCGNEGFSHFLTCTDYLVSGEQFEIKQCEGCGLKITANSEDDENIARYYQSDEYISHSNTSKGIVNTIYHSVRKYMLGRKRRLIEKTTEVREGHILDVGAGTGFFLNEMKRHDWQVSGIEKSRNAREFAQNEFGLTVMSPENLSEFKDNSFDIITLWHVLEHIHRLNENMELFGRLLKDNGRLIIAVPNNNSYDAIHYGHFWAAYDVPRHIWHFSPEQIKILGEKHGFFLADIYSMPFDTIYISILSEKYKKAIAPVLQGIIYGKISNLRSLVNKNRSSSIIYVLKK